MSGEITSSNILLQVLCATYYCDWSLFVYSSVQSSVYVGQSHSPTLKVISEQ